MEAAKRRKPGPMGACTKCGQLVRTYGEADYPCDKCGGHMEQYYRLAPMEECPACDGSGGDLTVMGPGYCGTCKGWGWQVARDEAGMVKRN